MGANSRTNETATAQKRVLLAGVGNVLRADDGFGPAVLRAFEAEGFPEGVVAAEMGIAGIELVRHLMDGYDALIIVDAVERGAEPGTLFQLEPEVPEIAALTAEQRRSASADMHQTVPDRALLVARAVGVLPSFVRIVGCQPGEMDEMAMSLTACVSAAVPQAAAMVRSIVSELNGTNAA